MKTTQTRVTHERARADASGRRVPAWVAALVLAAGTLLAALVVLLAGWF